MVETADGSGFGHGAKVCGRYEKEKCRKRILILSTSIPVDRTVSERGNVDYTGTKTNLVLRISETELF